MRVFRWFLALMVLVLLRPALADDLSALARLDAAQSSITSRGTGIDLTLAISQPVPWRVRVKDNPPRLIMDFREVDFTGVASLSHPAQVVDLRAGSFRPGWSRLVIELIGPMLVDSAEMVTEGGTQVKLRLVSAGLDAFRAEAAKPEPPDWALPKPVNLPPPVKQPGGPLVVVLDPGHGGLDPGAENGDVDEADVVLTFALELRDLLRGQGVDVVMTRDTDTFVPLETRTSIARAAGADVYLSLHADALPEGEAVGATVYTLAEAASDKAAQVLAERHDRDDLLAGVDLTRQDDLVATVLMDMARAETGPKTARLADALVTAIKAAGVRMHRHPHQEAGFSVLKSPDIPSVLLELGFLSSERDLARLTDKDWRAGMEAAIAKALATWWAGEAALAGP